MTASPRRRIGFVDDDLNNFHANTYHQLLRGELKERGFELAGCTASQADEGRQWADERDVAFFDDPAELDKEVDCYMILAPGSPHTHLPLCERILPFGKPTFVDKTFAPDLATAERIFALADRHGAPIQTSSALRYTDVQRVAESSGPIRHICAWGGGRSFDEYAIHPIEMVVSCMGSEAIALLRRGPEPESQLLVEFADQRTAVINVFTGPRTPFAAVITTREKTEWVQVDTSRLFHDALSAILDFCGTGESGIPRAETLTIHRILDAARADGARDAFRPL